jgi:glutamyl-tRNA(Gln) amidotransferase subunit D
MAKKDAKNQTKNQDFNQYIGDLVKIKYEDQTYEGIILPRNFGSSEFITFKLRSGYNIGLKKSKILQLDVIQKNAASFLEKQKSQEFDSKGKVVLLATGGTIVNKIDYRTGAVHPATTPQEILENVPSSLRAAVAPKILFSLPSEDLSPDHWVYFANKIADEIKNGAEGIVLTHGTDTMHYTSAALSFMLQNLPCPVILTGSQRSSDRGSSDAFINLKCSIAAAKEDISGVFVCMHDNLSDNSCGLFYGTKVRKMHTSRRDAFRSINVRPAAIISADDLTISKSPSCPKRKPKSDFILDTKLNTNVAIQYIYPGLKPSAIDALSTYDGVVLVGTGLGHVPTNLGNDPLSVPILKNIQQLIENGIAVVLTSQCIYGRINMNVYTNGRVLLDIGVIGNLSDMTPETAYVKLMWVLGKEKNLKKVKELMEKSIVGEISERTEITQF